MPEKCLHLIIEVVNVQGHCPVYRLGDQFSVRKGHQLVSDQPLCMHALHALQPYYVPLSRGITPAEIGLGGPQGCAYIQCVDPMRFTGGGTVTFRIRPCEQLPTSRFPMGVRSVAAPAERTP